MSNIQHLKQKISLLVEIVVDSNVAVWEVHLWYHCLCREIAVEGHAVCYINCI